MLLGGVLFQHPVIKKKKKKPHTHTVDHREAFKNHSLLKRISFYLNFCPKQFIVISRNFYSLFNGGESMDEILVQSLALL